MAASPAAGRLIDSADDSPGAAPDLYLPLHTNLLVDGARAAPIYGDENYYWMEMMGRLRPGLSMAPAQAVLAPRFHQWVATTATTDGERAKLPALILNPGAIIARIRYGQ